MEDFKSGSRKVLFIIGYMLFLGIQTHGQDIEFDKWFTGQTLRFDYYHSGTAGEEQISLDQIRLEADWPGSGINLIDGLYLGLYRFIVKDTQSNQAIYSFSFASIYGEWETTAEALDGKWRSFHESVRFPEPKIPFQLILEKRNPDGTYKQIYANDHDPKSRFINRSPITKHSKVRRIFLSGASEEKVDIVILGDGYSKMDIVKFQKDASRLTKTLFDTEPFKSRKKDFNVRTIEVLSPESGISNPRQNIWRNSALGTSYNSFDSDRYVLTYENKKVREIAAQAPYDVIVIIMNDPKYGGGGIYNLYATTASHSVFAEYVFVHEFGHSFASLGDEYYTSDVAYVLKEPEFEPNRSNVTALFDKDNLKWKHLVEKTTPVPTPWGQSHYDSIAYIYQQDRRKLIDDGADPATLDSLATDYRRNTIEILKSEEFYDKTGAFEGAGYLAKGLYRPEIDCIMFSRNRSEFCKVCTEAINQMIDQYTR
jgi:hypothetical protein